MYEYPFIVEWYLIKACVMLDSLLDVPCTSTCTCMYRMFDRFVIILHARKLIVLNVRRTPKHVTKCAPNQLITYMFIEFFVDLRIDRKRTTVSC